MTDTAARDQLRSIVERIERLEEEIKAMNDDKRDVYAEAKANGFDTKVLKKVIADRRKDSSEREEFNAIYDLYAQALGMSPEFQTGTQVATHVHAHEEKPESLASGPCEAVSETTAKDVRPTSECPANVSSDQKSAGVTAGETAIIPEMPEFLKRKPLQAAGA